MQQYRSAYKKRTAILLTTLETLPPSRLSPSPLMPHRKMPSRGQQLNKQDIVFVVFLGFFLLFFWFQQPKGFLYASSAAEVVGPLQHDEIAHASEG